MFRLTKRDYKILNLLAKLKALRLRHIQGMFFPSYQTAVRRLKKLDQNKYVKRAYIPSDNQFPEAVFVLGKEGATITGGIAGRINHKTQHVLAVNDVILALKLPAETEYNAGNFVADALLQYRGTQIFLELDRSNNDFRGKITNYNSVGGVVLIVTHRVKAITGLIGKTNTRYILVDIAIINRQQVISRILEQLDAVVLNQERQGILSKPRI